MVAAPADTPVTTPVLISIVATVTSLLLHVPPPVTILKGVVWPTHTAPDPVIGDSAFTATPMVTTQPAPVVYDIVTEPLELPVIMPDTDPIDAINVLLLLHVPPPTVFVKEVV